MSQIVTCIQFFKLLFEFIGSEAVGVQAIVPVDSVQYLQISSHQPVATLHHHLNQHKHTSESELSRTMTFLNDLHTNAQI